MGRFVLHTVEARALAELHAIGVGEAERAHAERIAARMSILLADQDLVEELRRTGFSGPDYEAFATAMAGYGDPVMRAWIRRGQIFALTAARGRPVECPDRVREHLARDVEDRQELAMEVVARALLLFRDHGLVAGTWKPTGGAALTTYFVGSCVLSFPNVFRGWLKEHEDGQRGRYIAIDPTTDRVAADPADYVCAMDMFCRIIAAAPSDKARAILNALVLRDVPYAEIGKLVGLSEAAVKQMIYRLRKVARSQYDEGANR